MVLRKDKRSQHNTEFTLVCARTLSSPIRKLEMAVAISEIFSDVSEGNSEKVFPEWRDALKFQDLARRDRRSCREPWVDNALDLLPPSVHGVFA